MIDERRLYDIQQSYLYNKEVQSLIKEIKRLRKHLKRIALQNVTRKVDDTNQIFDDSSPHPWKCNLCPKVCDGYNQKNDEPHHAFCPVGEAKAALDGAKSEWDKAFEKCMCGKSFDKHDEDNDYEVG